MTAGSDGPYQHHSNSKDNAELITIGGGNGMGGRKVVRKKALDTLDGSEEELVLGRGGFVGDVKAGEGGMVIVKKTEFEVSERSVGAEVERDGRLKPWEENEQVRR